MDKYKTEEECVIFEGILLIYRWFKMSFTFF